MNNEDYVSYELAKKLKECGFGDPCDSYSIKDNAPDGTALIVPTTDREDFNADSDCPFCKPLCSAPTLAQAQKWLRENWDWHIIVEPQIWDGLTYEFKLWHRFRGYENTNRGFHFSSYECALSTGISAALELIKKGE